MPSSSASVATTPSSSPPQQRRLDRPPLLGRVAGAVGREACGAARRRRWRAARRARCGRSARSPCGSWRSRWCAGRGARPAASSAGRLAERRGRARRSPRRAAAASRTPRSARPAARRRGRHGERQAGQRPGQLARVRDRGGGEQELRLAAVERADAPQPPQHAGDVRAEDAAVGVRLVDHDVRRFASRSAQRAWLGRIPTWSMSGLVSTGWPGGARRARVAGRVAVVDHRPQPDAEVAQRARLILRERLGRVDVERPRARLLDATARAPAG